MRPKRSLGQNFLSDEGTARAVLVHGRIESGSSVVEVGPGRGFLTRYILAAGAQVTAVEKDTALAAALQSADRTGRLTVVEGDFTQLDPSPFAGWVLVGNLPYNMSMPILRHALSFHRLWPRLIFMFQAEVAVRICAGHGSRDYGIPSVMVALTHKARVVRKVPPGAFFPRPRIDSALVLFEPLESPLCADHEREPFLSFVSDTFKYRRKTAANAMSRASTRSAGEMEELLAASGAPARARPETLSPQQMLHVWRLSLLPAAIDP